jgi:hypothetical protein
MITTSSNVEIAVPRETLYKFITDPDKTRRWQSNLVEIVAEPGMPEGSTGRMVEALMGRHLTYRFEILVNDGKSFTKALSNQGPLQFETSQTLDELAPGRTKFTVLVKINAGRVFLLAEPLLEWMAHGRVESDLKTLKKLMEKPG